MMKMVGQCIDLIFFIFQIYYALFVICWSFIRAIYHFIIPRRQKDINDDIILITGGGRGLGRYLAVEFAKKSPKCIVLWGRTEVNLKMTCDAVRNHSVSCIYMVCDVSNSIEVKKMAQKVCDEIGSVSILINNAGIMEGKRLLDCNDDKIRETFDTNILAHFWTVKAFLPGMIEMNKGQIVTISSFLGLVGLAGALDYSASKFSTTGFTESLSLEIQRMDKPNIKVTSIHPYVIDTSMFAGISIRFKWLFPPLLKEEAAANICDAILREELFVILPKMFHFVVALKHIIPREAFQVICQICGLDRCMDTYIENCNH